MTILFTVFLGCSGSMQGIVRHGGYRVQFSYNDPKFGPGEIRTVLPDGEGFEGRFEDFSTVGSRTESDSNAAKHKTALFARSGEMESFKGGVEAVLYGNKGHSMKCRFRPTDLVFGLPGGGIGLCEISDERLIDVYF